MNAETSERDLAAGLTQENRATWLSVPGSLRNVQLVAGDAGLAFVSILRTAQCSLRACLQSLED